MAQYISLKTFERLFPEKLDLYTDEGLSAAKSIINGLEARKIAENNGYTIDDISHLANSLDSSSVVLFQSWIERSVNLENFLLKKSVDEFHDVASILTHRYLNEFKRYVSPFLADRLLSSTYKNDSELRVLFTYVVLLDQDHRSMVEDQLFKSIRERLRYLDAESINIKEEQDLIQLIKPLCSDNNIVIVNSLSKASYALKLGYVDSIVNSIRTSGCTVRFANWILKQMEQLELNNEHNEKILELRNDLRDGNLEVRNHGSGKTPIRWRSILTFFFVLLIGGGAFFVIYFKPFSGVEEPEFEDTSSFTQFTVEDRKKIDSLIQSMESQFVPEDIDIDPGYPLNNQNTMFSVRHSFKNKLLENIYTDLSKDAAIQKNQAVDSCELKRKKFQRYSGVKDLLSRKGKIKCIIKNESDYDAVLYIAENKTKGKVYSLYIKQGSTKKFEMNRGDIVYSIAGNTYIPYVKPSNVALLPLPSKEFKYHFCDTDANYEESINTAYEFTDQTRTSAKFMIMGSYGSYYRLMDIYGVLSDY